MTTQTAPQTVHCFEAAGLGKAPFRYVGMVAQDISYGMANVEIKTAGGGSVICQTKPGGTCDYCGTYIVNMFQIESSDGNRFKVGCDCVMKTGDAGLMKVVNEEVRRRERQKRTARKLAAEKVDYDLCMETDLGRLNGKPHPTPARDALGETLGDWARWMRDGRYFKTLAATIRRELGN